MSKEEFRKMLDSIVATAEFVSKLTIRTSVDDNVVRAVKLALANDAVFNIFYQVYSYLMNNEKVTKAQANKFIATLVTMES